MTERETTPVALTQFATGVRQASEALVPVVETLGAQLKRIAASVRVEVTEDTRP